MPEEEPEKDDDMPGSPFWMTTYGDMVTLLLTFFVLMFAMSAINEQKFRAAAESLAQWGMGLLPQMGAAVETIGISQVEAPPTEVPGVGIAREKIDLMASIEQIEQMFAKESLEDLASIQVTGAGEALVRLGDEVLFDAGEAELKPQASRVLRSIANSIRGKTKRLYVEGHSDNLPIHTPKYPSNWELSGARALTVVRLLEAEGIAPDQLAAVSRGEYQPIAPNDTPEGRALNRRVELYITWSDTL
jgi:chemotaxis protein MotB